MKIILIFFTNGLLKIGRLIVLFLNKYEKILYDIIYSRLTCSLEMAQLVERSAALDLAEFIYRKLHAHYEAASCLLQTGEKKEHPSL